MKSQSAERVKKHREMRRKMNILARRVSRHNLASYGYTTASDSCDSPHYETAQEDFHASVNDVDNAQISDTSIENTDNVTEDSGNKSSSEVLSTDSNFSFNERNVCDYQTDGFNEESSGTEFSPYFLAMWAADCNIQQNHLSQLLQLIRKDPTHKDWPKDSRTVMRTLRKVDVEHIAEGSYYHFGLEERIMHILKKKSVEEGSTIDLSFGIDGVPISKSSKGQLWPILCRLVSLKNAPVFPIGIWYGESKPTCYNEFLTYFVLDLIKVLDNGIYINDEKFRVLLKHILCDAPAKASVLNIKHHSGYSSCSKCKVRGAHINRRTCFPGISFPPRTHADFLARIDADHHNGNTMLTNIVQLNVIDHFPVDPMHCVYLGVTKKLLRKLWIEEVSCRVHFSKGTKFEISLLLESYQSWWPSEFQRKPRSLDDICYWKATEYRNFLLYLAPVALAKVFPEKENDVHYLHVLLLHVAIRLLHNIDSNEIIQYAKELLEQFVTFFGQLYGRCYVSYCVHSLLHLPEDCSIHGNIDTFSAFPFENFLHPLKKLIRKSEKPLEQIIRRIYERDNFIDSKVKDNKDNFYGIHDHGPLLEDCIDPQFSAIRLDRWEFKLSVADKDSCCILSDGTYVKIVNFCYKIVNGGRTKLAIIIEEFLELQDIYEIPCSSSHLGCLKAGKLSKEFKVRLIEEVSGKVVCLPLSTEGYALMPLLHTF